MATIPLAALALKTPEQQSGPLQNAAALSQLVSAKQQREANALGIQQKQYEIGQTKAINKAYQDALSVDSSGSPSIDTDKLTQSLAQAGYGSATPGILKNTADYQKSIADAQKSMADVQSSMRDAMGSVGNAIKQANYDPNLADLYLQHQLALPNLPPSYKQQLQQTDQQLKQNPATVKQIADGLIANSEKQQGFQNAKDVANIRANTPEAQELKSYLTQNPGKTAADYPAAKAASTAQATAPIEEQRQIDVETNPQVIAARANAAAQSEIQRNKALAPDLSKLVQTTSAGGKYVSAEDVKGASESLLRKQASDQGIPVVDKDVSSMLNDLDTARSNQRSMLSAIQGKLASSPSERIYKGPENKLQAAMQTDPTLAAMGTFRNAAIQSMRAVAGSKGLRINQAEVQLAIDNDIPKLTDTWAVANAKIQMLQKFIDNTEGAHLLRNRQTGQPNGPQGNKENDPLGIR